MKNNMKINSIAALLLIGTTVIMAETSPDSEEMFNDPEPPIHHKELLPHETDGIVPEGTEVGSNTYYGEYAGNEDGGHGNSFFGYYAGYYNTSRYNTFIGTYSGYSNTTGMSNTFSGSYSGMNNTTGKVNTFNGSYSGYNNTEGYSNTFGGTGSGNSNTTGYANTFSGTWSGYSNTTGYFNTFSGYLSGNSNTTGYDNTFSGIKSGFKNTTGSRNVFLGSYAGYNETGSYKLYIDNSSTTTPLIYGEFDTNTVTINGKLGLNTKSPKEAVDVLRVNGAARFQLTSETDTASNTAQFIQRRSRAGATAIERNDNMGQFSFRGHNGVEYSSTRAGIAVLAAEDWAEGMEGTRMIFTVTPNSSSTTQHGLRIENDGDVYVPNGNLYVKGKKMNVPDYVFKDNYKLMPLDELKLFVQKNNHLPGVVSAEEVGKAGMVNLSGLQMTLLEKVEELTLYTLQQEEVLTSKDVEIGDMKAETKSMQFELESKDKRMIVMEARQEAQEEKIAKLESILINLTLDTSHASKEKVSME